MRIKKSLATIGATGALVALALVGATAANAAVTPNSNGSTGTGVPSTTVSAPAAFNTDAKHTFTANDKVVFTANNGATFPAQTTVVGQYRAAASTGAWNNWAAFYLKNCVVSNAGTTLTCDGGTGAWYPRDAARWSPKVTIPANAPVGTITVNAALTAGASSGTGTSTITVTRPVPTATVDTSTSPNTITGTGTPGATIVARNSAGAEIGSAVVGSDGTYTLIPNEEPADLNVALTEVIGGISSESLTVQIVATPIVAPAIAGGAGLVLIAAAGAGILVRNKRRTHAQSAA